MSASITGSPPLLRCDLHVHTCHSKINGNLPFLRARDCYSRPEDVYRVARRRGMDLVAVTDHDSIDGCLQLLERRPDASDIIVGEEVSCFVPDTRLEVHLGVYGMTEALHRDVQPLRANVFDVAGRLRRAGVFFALNHLFHFYRDQVPLDVYLRLLDEVPAVEVRNGTMLAAHNALVEAIRVRRGAAGGRPLGLVAGSDAHTLRRVGTTWTAAPGSTRDKFVESLRRGLGRPGGAHGTALTIAGDAYGVIAAYCGSLAGYGPPDHGWLQRVAFGLFGIVSIPAEWLPLAIAAHAKRREARMVARVAAALGDLPDPATAANGAAAAAGRAPATSGP